MTTTPSAQPLWLSSLSAANSLIADSSRPEIVHQWDAVNETTGQIADMLESGWQGVVITHGNGPQVGFILRAQ